MDRPRGLLALLVGLLLENTAFAVFLYEQSGELTSTLAAQDSGRYWIFFYKEIITAASSYKMPRRLRVR